MEEEYMTCQCSDFNHTVRFTLDPQDGDVYLDVRMNYYDPWWKRIWNAVKYVFKRDVAYGYYDCTLLREEDYDRLRDLMRRSEIAKAGAHARAREQLVKQ
jgi:hypothetical protein